MKFWCYNCEWSKARAGAKGKKRRKGKGAAKKIYYFCVGSWLLRSDMFFNSVYKCEIWSEKQAWIQKICQEHVRKESERLNPEGVHHSWWWRGSFDKKQLQEPHRAGWHFSHVIAWNRKNLDSAPQIIVCRWLPTRPVCDEWENNMNKIKGQII